MASRERPTPLHAGEYLNIVLDVRDDGTVLFLGGGTGHSPRRRRAGWPPLLLSAVGLFWFWFNVFFFFLMFAIGEPRARYRYDQLIAPGLENFRRRRLQPLCRGGLLSFIIPEYNHEALRRHSRARCWTISSGPSGGTAGNVRRKATVKLIRSRRTVEPGCGEHACAAIGGRERASLASCARRSCGAGDHDRGRTRRTALAGPTRLFDIAW